MLRAVATFACILWACGSPKVSSTRDHTAPHLLTPEQAIGHAERGLAGRLPLLPEAYHRAARSAAPQAALLVERIDRTGSDEGRFYYIVPYGREDRTTLLVLVDAVSGRFKEASYLQQPGKYPPLTAAEARSRVAATVPDDALRAKVLSSEAGLVWMPSEQSLSPAEPLWRIEASGRDWFVDQTGGVHEAIEAPKMKGGGPPDPPRG